MTEVAVAQSPWLWVGIAALFVIVGRVSTLIKRHNAVRAAKREQEHGRMRQRAEERHRRISDRVESLVRFPPTGMAACIDAAQFLVSAEKRYRQPGAYQPMRRDAEKYLVASAAKLLADLLRRAETGDDEAFAELRDLFVEVERPEREVVELFGTPALIMSPFELFVECGMDSVDFVERFSALANRQRAAAGAGSAD